VLTTSQFYTVLKEITDNISDNLITRHEETKTVVLLSSRQENDCQVC